MNKALSGIRIIDMTHNQAGPACAQILGFLGADVIKLEEPKGGDVARTVHADRKNSDSLFFLLFNANKRSLALNLKSEDGKRLFRQVVAKSDVLLENFGPGALDRLGLGYEALKEINPRLVYATIKGFGTYGPHAHFKSYEPVPQAMGGAPRRTERDRRGVDAAALEARGHAAAWRRRRAVRRLPGHRRGAGRPASEGARDDRRYRLSDARHLPDRRLPDQTVGLAGRNHPAAAAGRAQRHGAGGVVRRQPGRIAPAARRRRRVGRVSGAQPAAYRSV